MINNMLTWLTDMIEAAEHEHNAPRGVLWRGLPGKGELSASQLDELKAAGVSEMLFNINDAGARGKWRLEQSKSKIYKRIEAAAAAGFSIGLMPWVWCNPGFMSQCGQELAAILKDLEHMHIRLVQMDFEGSAELSAKAGAKRAGVSLDAFVDESLKSLCEHLPPHIALGITTLYFRRPAGDAAIKWQGNINGQHWQVSEWIGQFYSPWLTSPPHSEKKAKATHASNFQPPMLQERGNAFYSPLYPYMSSRGAGVNMWALERPGMSASEALDLAVEAVAQQGHNVFAGWAGHLIMNKPARFELALKAFERVCRGGPRVDEGVRVEAWGNPPPGFAVDWSELTHLPHIAPGGRPAGYVPIKKVGLTSRDVAPLAKYTRGIMLDKGLPRGSCVPATYKTRRLLCCLQKHTATYRRGKLITGLNCDGLTIFAQQP